MEAGEIKIGPFRLDLRRRQLSRDGVTVRLGSRALEILCTLASAEGQLVSKDELMAQVWPGLVVEENAIQVHVSALRKVLGETEDGSSYVITVPGRGYRRAPVYEHERGSRTGVFCRWHQRRHYHRAIALPMVPGDCTQLELCLQRKNDRCDGSGARTWRALRTRG